MTTPWTDEHSKLVVAATPDAAQPSETDLDRVWNRVAGELDAPPVRRRRSRLRVTLGAGVIAAVVGVSGVAAAGVWSAHTGRQVEDAETLRLSGPGEYIDHYAPDYPRVYREVTADIPFADERARRIDYRYAIRDARRAVRSWEGTGRDPRERSVQIEGELRADTARSAICSWANAWARAVRDGDVEAREHAASAIAASVSWPAVTDVDPKPALTPSTMKVRQADGSVRMESYVNETPFGHLPRLVDAVHAGDVRAAGTAMLRGIACWPELVPDLPTAVPAEFRVR